MKKEIRVLGIDDAPFEFDQKEVLVIGTFFRGGATLDGVISMHVQKDGDDATLTLIESIAKSKFRSQLQAIFLDGIAVGGFNVINIHALYQHTTIPVIVVVRQKPDFERLKKTLQKLGMGRKYQLMEKAGIPLELQLQQGKIYFQYAGTTEAKARELLRLCSVNSNLPEAIRVAHLIGAGIVKGESSGRA